MTVTVEDDVPVVAKPSETVTVVFTDMDVTPWAPVAVGFPSPVIEEAWKK